jgi:hypothetical protein
MTRIEFGPGSEAHFSIFAAIAEREYVVDIKFERDVNGLPGDRVMVLKADDDGIIVCERGDDGSYWRIGTYHIGYDEIKTLTVV